MGECRTCANWKRVTQERHHMVYPKVPLGDWLAGKELAPRLEIVVRHYSPYGHCAMAQYGEEASYSLGSRHIKCPTAPLIYGDNENYYAWLQTHASFGCNQHTPKEARHG